MGCEAVVEVSCSEADANEAAQLMPVEPPQLGLWPSLALSGVYIGSSIMSFLAIRYIRVLEKRGEATYNNAAIVMSIEVAKMLVSVTLRYLSSGEFVPFSVTVGPQRWHLWRMSWLYITPAFLYALYNNLTYVNLRLFDPGTVQLFMQTRILFTGFLFVFLLHRSLSMRQWGALGILTVGLFIKYVSPTVMQAVGVRLLAIQLQAFLSSLAGVYNEVAFKREAGTSIHLQNFFMYLYGILFNLMLGLLVAPQKYLHESIFCNSHVILIPIILLGTINGLTAAFMLKFINVIVKAFAASVEVILTPVVAAAVLGEPLTWQDFTAGVFVMCSVYLYYTKGCGGNVTCKSK
ncbi:putative nucleotide sugar transporter [Trypanosoma rangeli]|uniref:Putative nucleotide sugar transporter n=1 Tax=Trypanosoma rangeli TaxID=5698 RepID=A0A422NRC3_TRYRA|nr:putative nucleotide sugar transporter [Trypanosoma rangeli]RNF08015.1 putative nucleotide sugar transporter [Trypanosoma rangeli]|eukprot:RNF08015.1 putative nucleotide sugar transporter [Trypanosoma rangeli]